MHHRAHDQIGLALAHAVADGLASRPDWLDIARANLDRWSRLNADAPSLLACYAEWRQLLSLPLAQIQAVLRDPSAEGQRLRQNSPFAGVLTPREVWQIKEQCRRDASAA